MTERTPVLERLPGEMTLRRPTVSDHPRLLAALADWWGGQGGAAGVLQRQLLLPRLFLQHFADTSYLVERADGTVHAFLIGFLSQSDPGTAYIHFIAVSPDGRGDGWARGLYRRYFAMARDLGRNRVRCITSPANRTSIAFHTRLGFRMEPGDRLDNDIPVHSDYDGPGLDRVSFVRDL